MHGAIKQFRCENGPEFISTAIKKWLTKLGVNVLYIQPGSPWQNGSRETSKLHFEMTIFIRTIS
jgi:putative transposase